MALVDIGKDKLAISLGFRQRDRALRCPIVLPRWKKYRATLHAKPIT
jgi:hypothetical protein